MNNVPQNPFCHPLLALHNNIGVMFYLVDAFKLFIFHINGQVIVIRIAFYHHQSNYCMCNCIENCTFVG